MDSIIPIVTILLIVLIIQVNRIEPFDPSLKKEIVKIENTLLDDLDDWRRSLVQEQLKIQGLENRYKFVKRRNREYEKQLFNTNRRYRALIRGNRETLSQQRFFWLPNRFFQFDVSDERYL